MSEPIQRNGKWWHRADDGTWLVYDEATQAWQAAGAAPPPPPAPAGAIQPPSPASVSVGAGDPLPAHYQPIAASKPTPVRPLVLVAAATALALVVVAVFVGSLLSASGGGAESSAAPVPVAASQSSGGALPQQKFVKKADALCMRAARKMKALGQPATKQQLVAMLDRSVAIGGRYLVQLQALGSPQRDPQGWADYLELNGRAVALFEDLSRQIQYNDAADVAAAFEEFRGLTLEATRFERGFGMTRCARVGGSQ